MRCFMSTDNVNDNVTDNVILALVLTRVDGYSIVVSSQTGSKKVEKWDFVNKRLVTFTKHYQDRKTINTHHSFLNVVCLIFNMTSYYKIT